MWQVLAVHRIAAGLALTALFSVPATHASPTGAARSAEVQVPCGNLFGVGPPSPLRNLCKALTKHPKSRFFRVTWDSTATLVNDSCTALYDRQRHTLKLVQRQSWHIDGEEYAEVKQSLDEWLFSRVDDAKLRRLNRRHAEDYSGDNASLGHFPRLSGLGCPKRRLKHFASSRRQKY